MKDHNWFLSNIHIFSLILIFFGFWFYQSSINVINEDIIIFYCLLNILEKFITLLFISYNYYINSVIDLDELNFIKINSILYIIILSFHQSEIFLLFILGLYYLLYEHLFFIFSLFFYFGHNLLLFIHHLTDLLYWLFH